MRAHELIKEIEWSPAISKRSVFSKKGMTLARKLDARDSNVKRYDIPELPGHTIEYFPGNYYQSFYLVDDDTEEVVATISIDNYGRIKNKMAYYVDGVKLVPELQGRRIGPTLYKFMIVDMGITLVSGETQSPGSAKLWARLAEDPEIKVVAYYPDNNKTSPVAYDRENQRLMALKGNPLYGDYWDKVVLVATKR